MDPVTAIGLISAVVDLVGACRSVIEVIKIFKDGDRELSAVSHDIQIFSEALVCLDRMLRGRYTIQTVPYSLTQDSLKDASVLVEDLRTRLVQISKSDYSAVRRAKWAHHKSSIIQLQGQLKEKYYMLNSFLSLTNLKTVQAIHSQLPRFTLSEPVTQGAVEEPEIEEDLTAEASFLRVPEHQTRVRRQSGGSTKTIESVSDSGSSYMERLSIVSSAASVRSASSWSSTASDTFLTDNMLEPGTLTTIQAMEESRRENSQLTPNYMFLVRHSCRYDCHCHCHEQSPTKPPKRFGSFKRRGNQCSEPSCRGNAASDRFTDHSILKALSQVLSAKSTKVPFGLKTYRMVPEGVDAMRHVKHGNLNKLKACIESGEATIYDTAPDGWSLLHTAAYNRHPHIVKYLIELGADTRAGDVGSRNSADLAVLKSIGQDATDVEQSIVEIFSRNNDILQDFEFTPIHIAVLKLYDAGDSERPSLKRLIDAVDDANNAPPNTNWGQWKSRYSGRSPLFNAIIEYFRVSATQQAKGSKIIHNLLDRKDKKYDWTPLHWAASAGRLDEMRTLVECGANPLILSNLDANILHAAAESKLDRGLSGALKIWKHCSDKLNINQANRWKETPLHVSSWCSAACVKLLLESGADPGPREENGQVPLHCAGLSGQSPERRKIVSLLCKTENNSHINTQDFEGRPPIFDFLDDPECVELLVLHGARLDLTDKFGRNVFHHTCIQGESESLATILRLSKEPLAIVAKNSNGNTPLIEALSMSNIECAMMILKLDDIGDTIGKDGWAPVHYAAKIGDPDLLEAVFKNPTFRKGTNTLDGKRAHDVAMESSNWHGRVKELIRKHDYLPVIWLD